MKSDLLAKLAPPTPGAVPRIDLHLHTSWTDGADKAADMYASALKCGLTHVLFSEHARKTSGDWFGRFADEVRSLPRGSCRALVGVETKIEDLEGTLDCTPEILGLCDLVMASVHRFPGERGVVRGFDEVTRQEAPETEFRLALSILKNPNVDILAHPFGMCYRRFGAPPSDELMRELIRAVARTPVAFEINCHYHPDPWKLARWCVEEGARISLGSNAHNVSEVGRIVRALEGTGAVR
ncbi:MAG: DNA polymerase/3'-5' exonuclease PolX [Candidatus Omnitrophica bacterium]|nr:DNA polymerase/3'-5' exonuclease PolX [Candidatus Omnitrophota bacterium]